MPVACCGVLYPGSAKVKTQNQTPRTIRGCRACSDQIFHELPCSPNAVRIRDRFLSVHRPRKSWQEERTIQSIDFMLATQLDPVLCSRRGNQSSIWTHRTTKLGKCRARIVTARRWCHLETSASASADTLTLSSTALRAGAIKGSVC